MANVSPDEQGAPAAPQVLRSRIVYDGFVRVRLDEVRLPSGRDARREVVEHPGAVGILALTEAGEVLLVRQWRHAAGQVLLEIPAGTREPGESVEETARRELVEEVGYEAGSVNVLLTFFPSPGYSGERIVLVRADDCRLVERVADPDEGVSVVIVPRSRVPALIAGQDALVCDGKTLIALQLLLAGDSADPPPGSMLTNIPH
jgi:ADP-ribose pyrophosphatase